MRVVLVVMMRFLAQIVFVFLLWSSLVTGRELTFCHVEMPPYSFVGPEGEADGIKVRMLQDVVARIEGVEARVVFLPWGRCIEYARAGQVDGVLPLFYSDARSEFMAFSTPLFHQEIRFWYKRSAFPMGLQWSGDFDEITSLRLGQLSHSFLGTALRDAFEANGTIVHATQLEGLMKMLMKGRVDLFVTDHLIGWHYVHKNRWGRDIAPIERPVTRLPTQFGLSRASGAAMYLEQFNNAIKALQDSGAIAERLRSAGYEG